MIPASVFLGDPMARKCDRSWELTKTIQIKVRKMPDQWQKSRDVAAGVL
jgi:hypothetical protein